MDELPGLVPLEGGFSGETFVTDYAGEQAVLRIYGRRSAARGPLASEIDAAVLRLVRGLAPVPEVLEVRRADAASGLPALMVTSYLPGERLDLVLPTLSEAERLRVAAELGTLIGRLGHLAQPRVGVFADPLLSIEAFTDAEDLPAWVERHSAELQFDATDLDALRSLADDAQTLLDETDRICLVHSDFNPKNILVDPDDLTVTGLLDWEFAHAGSPYADLGNLLRFEEDTAFADAVLAAYAAFMPNVPDRLRERARAVDLFALVDLAARRDENPVAQRAHDLLLQRARSEPGGSVA